MILLFAEAAQIREHAAASTPEEACGVILERPGGARELLAAQNVQNLLRVFRPEEPPATQAYAIDPTTLLRVGAMVAWGWAVAVIYHSHTNGYLGLSARDRAAAAPGGRMLYPDAAYLVAVGSGDGFGMTAWVWRDGEFQEDAINIRQPRKDGETVEVLRPYVDIVTLDHAARAGSRVRNS